MLRECGNRGSRGLGVAAVSSWENQWAGEAFALICGVSGIGILVTMLKLKFADGCRAVIIR